MQFNVLQKSLTEAECDVLVVNLFEGVKQPGGGTGAVDKAVGGAITQLIERENFEGKLGQTVDLTPASGVKAPKILVVGLGKQEEFNANKVREASSAAARKAKEFSAKKVATILHGAGTGGIEPSAAARALVEGTILGTYEYTKHKTKDVKPNPLEQIDIIELDAAKIDAIKQGISRGQITAEATNFARDLTNEPANILTPTLMAEQAASIAKEGGLECRIIGQEEMKQLGMNLILAVAKGSMQEPKFIILKYTAPGASKTVAFVGKGITFDSGGLNLKQGEGMADMKDDMSGAGVVLATMSAVAKLKPKVNVLGIMPATENMIGGNATHPGDVIRGFSGKTVEINNTDAEGRLILVDGVAFAEKEGADEIIDIATLTGACVVALGRQMAGILGTDQSMIDRIISAGEESGEKFWQLPLHEGYQDTLKSDVADMKNSPGHAGTITAALFIKE
ncbi:MAG TPA: leucyl aminopeptidase, partial [Armatimonadota bacterium]|nr:leucyl aminopeptidase [Armatimonadota bacterium]